MKGEIKMKLKKSLYLMLCTVLIIAISACAKIQEPSTNIPNTDVMLVVTSSFVSQSF